MTRLRDARYFKLQVPGCFIAVRVSTLRPISVISGSIPEKKVRAGEWSRGAARCGLLETSFIALVHYEITRDTRVLDPIGARVRLAAARRQKVKKRSATRETAFHRCRLKLAGINECMEMDCGYDMRNVIFYMFIDILKIGGCTSDRTITRTTPGLGGCQYFSILSYIKVRPFRTRDLLVLMHAFQTLSSRRT